MPKPYPPAFRRQALALLASSLRVRNITASLDTSETCLHRWKSAGLRARSLRPGTGDEEPQALAATQKRIRDLEEVNILRKAAAVVREAAPPSELADDGLRVNRACLELGVSTSGCYEWKSRSPPRRSIRHA